MWTETMTDSTVPRIRAYELYDIIGEEAGLIVPMSDKDDAVEFSTTQGSN